MNSAMIHQTCCGRIHALDKLALANDFLVSMAASATDTVAAVEIALLPFFNSDDLSLLDRLQVLLRKVSAFGCVNKVAHRIPRPGGGHAFLTRSGYERGG